MKILYVSTISLTINTFFKLHIKMLIDAGHSVDIACNDDGLNIDTFFINLGSKVHNIPFSRSVISKNNIRAYKQIKDLISKENYDLVHSHTPIASAITRMACHKMRKNGMIVMYTCHGFHFHNASPKKNWLLYYPIEKYLSRYCDYIITINKEDYQRAKTFYCKNVRYIPSVGVDINKIKQIQIDKKEYKKALGLPENCILVLSVGELNKNKNHEVIVRAISKLKNDNIYYAIAGKGPLKDYLEQLSDSLGIADHVKFLGFRNDVPELCNVADISAFPSLREGLGLAGIEAMAAGVPLVSSNVHGILDYVVDGKTGYTCKPNDVDAFAKSINKLAENPILRDSMRQNCLDAVEPFEINHALNEMWKIYKEILK